MLLIRFTQLGYLPYWDFGGTGLGTRGLGLVLDNKIKIHRMSFFFSVLKASQKLEEMEQWTMSQSSERQLAVSTLGF